MEENNDARKREKLLKKIFYVSNCLKEHAVEIIFTYIILILCVYAYEVNDWLFYNGEIIQTLSLYANEEPIINFATSVLFIIAVLMYIWYIYTSNGSYVRSLIHVFAAFLVFQSSAWKWYDSFCFISYKWECIIILVFAILMDLYKLCNKNSKSSNSYRDIKNDSPNRKYLVEAIISALKIADVSEDSYAVGISGEWGAGKTTFLNVFKHEMTYNGEDEYSIFDFNPWECDSPDKIISEFFNKFASQFKDGSDQETRKLILSYFAAICQAVEIPLADKVKRLLKVEEDLSLDQKKSVVNEKLRGSKKKYIVCVDDIDRLDADELFEVLRLIRNTANFSNVIFIVTYDKNYVVEMLAEKGIKKAEQYIKKIFNVEVGLPSHESHIILDIIYNDVKRIVVNQHVLNELCKILKEKEKDQYVILKHLDNFRDVKRFANMFAIHLSLYIGNRNIYDMSNEEIPQGKLSVKAISLKDFFWLEMLSYCDSRVYDLLKNNARAILNVDSNNINLTYNPKNDLEIDGKTKEILIRLFGNESSISKRDNYERYFAYGNLNFEMTDDLFSYYLHHWHDKEIAGELISLNSPFRTKDLKSLYEKMASYDVGKDYMKDCQYVGLLAACVPCADDGNNYKNDLFTEKLKSNNFEQYTESQKRELVRMIYSALSNGIMNSSCRAEWAKILTELLEGTLNSEIFDRNEEIKQLCDLAWVNFCKIKGHEKCGIKELLSDDKYDSVISNSNAHIYNGNGYEQYNILYEFLVANMKLNNKLSWEEFQVWTQKTLEGNLANLKYKTFFSSDVYRVKFFVDVFGISNEEAKAYLNKEFSINDIEMPELDSLNQTMNIMNEQIDKMKYKSFT